MQGLLRGWWGGGSLAVVVWSGCGKVVKRSLRAAASGIAWRRCACARRRRHCRCRGGLAGRRAGPCLDLGGGADRRPGRRRRRPRRCRDGARRHRRPRVSPRGGRAHARVRRPVRGRPLAEPAASRRRPGLRLLVARDRRPATAGGCSSPGCRSSGPTPTGCSRRRSTPARAASRRRSRSTSTSARRRRRGRRWRSTAAAPRTWPTSCSQRPSGADPPGTARGELRVARTSGRLWSTFGFPLNRNPQAPLRLPTAVSAPRVAIDATGNGIVAWQEPDEELVDRVWARRLFSTTAGIPLAVSPRSWADKPLRAAADAFSLDVAGFGQGAIAFRQQPGEGGALSGPRVMLATIPETFVTGAAAFGAPRVVDGAGGASPGAPAVATTRSGDVRVAFSLAQRTLLTEADDAGVGQPRRVDDGRSSAPGEPLAELGPSGAAVVAWKVRRGSAGGVGISERRADGVPVRQTLSAPAGGPVAGLALAGSGLGDALVAWVQGGQVAAAVVRRPAGPVRRAGPDRLGAPRSGAAELGRARARDRRRPLRDHGRRRHGRRGPAPDARGRSGCGGSTTASGSCRSSPRTRAARRRRASRPSCGSTRAGRGCAWRAPAAAACGCGWTTVRGAGGRASIAPRCAWRGATARGRAGGRGSCTATGRAARSGCWCGRATGPATRVRIRRLVRP